MMEFNLIILSRYLMFTTFVLYLYLAHEIIGTKAHNHLWNLSGVDKVD